MSDVTEVVMPAGRYYVGDPCYAIESQELWMQFLESCDYFRASHVAHVGVAKVIVGFSTAYGDGVYQDQQGREYPVDAGLLGVVPIAWWTKNPGDLMQVVEFLEPFTVYKSGSVIGVGPIQIETDPIDTVYESCSHCGMEMEYDECSCMDAEEEA